MFLGIEIGGTKLQLGVGSGQGSLVTLERAEIERARGAEGIRERILELGRRLAETATVSDPDDVFYLVTDELTRAIEARKRGDAVPEFVNLTAERRELREARKRLHPPGTIPLDASEDPNVKFKETQFVNDPSSDTLKGVPVSPGTVTGTASLIRSPPECRWKEHPGGMTVVESFWRMTAGPVISLYLAKASCRCSRSRGRRSRRSCGCS